MQSRADRKAAGASRARAGGNAGPDPRLARHLLLATNGALMGRPEGEPPPGHHRRTGRSSTSRVGRQSRNTRPLKCPMKGPYMGHQRCERAEFEADPDAHTRGNEGRMRSAHVRGRILSTFIRPGPTRARSWPRCSRLGASRLPGDPASSRAPARGLTASTLRLETATQVRAIKVGRRSLCGLRSRAAYIPGSRSRSWLIPPIGAMWICSPSASQ